MCYATVTVRQKDNIVHVPCGKCGDCLSRKRNEWTFRLMQEWKISKSCICLTLTYADENLPESGSVIKKDIQDFNKRLRKQQQKHTTQKVRYYVAAEYGEKTNRPHYHGIYYNVHPKLFTSIDGIWGKGNINIDVNVGESAMAYTTKYIINKEDAPTNLERPFALMSTKPAIGINYLSNAITNYHKKQDITHVTKPSGHKQVMPRIYRKKLYAKGYSILLANKQQIEADKAEEKLIKKAEEKGIPYYQRIHENRIEAFRKLKNNSKSKNI